MESEKERQVRSVLRDLVMTTTSAEADPGLYDMHIMRAQDGIKRILGGKRHILLPSVLLLGAGAAGGIYVNKKAPNWWYIRNVKYAAAGFRLWQKLDKVIKEEYYLFDEMFETEYAFYQMTRPEPWQGISFNLTLTPITDPPPGQARRVRLSVATTPVGDDKDD